VGRGWQFCPAKQDAFDIDTLKTLDVNSDLSGGRPYTSAVYPEMRKKPAGTANLRIRPWALPAHGVTSGLYRSCAIDNPGLNRNVIDAALDKGRERLHRRQLHDIWRLMMFGLGRFC